MSTQLPNIYLPEEWAELSDEQREASARLEAWFRADSERIRAPLEVINEEVIWYPGAILDRAVPANFLHFMVKKTRWNGC